MPVRQGPSLPLQAKFDHISAAQKQLRITAAQAGVMDDCG